MDGRRTQNDDKSSHDPWIRWAKGGGGAYYFLSMVKSPKKNHGFNNNGSSSITDNMITFNGISVSNFKFKQYSL
jgi:hypothetical protein